MSTLILCFFIQVNAQQNTFSKVLYDANGTDLEIISAVPSFDMGYIIAGSWGGLTGIVLKTDSIGTIKWNRLFGINQNLQLFDITPTFDSCFVVAGKIGNNALIFKIDQEGDTIWLKTFNQNDQNLEFRSIQQTQDSGYVMVGNTNSKVYVVKTDANGATQWSKFLYINGRGIIGNSIKWGPDTSYLITGSIDGNAIFLLKLSSDGLPLWAKQYQFPNSQTSNIFEGFDVLITNNGYLLYGYPGNPVLIKTDDDGSPIWCKSYTSSMFPEFSLNSKHKLHETHDSCYIFAYGSRFSGGTLIKADSTGNIKWVNQLGLIAFDVIEAKTKELLIIGNGPLYGVKKSNVYSSKIGLIQTDSLGNGLNCIGFPSFANAVNDSVKFSVVTFLTQNGGAEGHTKLDIYSATILVKEGCVDYLGLDESKSDNDIYIQPNPNNGIFNVEFSEFKSGKFSIFNCYGQLIYQSDFYDKLSQIDLSNHLNGIYFFRILFSDKSTSTGKFIMIK